MWLIDHVSPPLELMELEPKYIKRLTNDPWGNPYQLRQPGEHSEFDIFSFGADGQAGGEELDADIGNWLLR